MKLFFKVIESKRDSIWRNSFVWFSYYLFSTSLQNAFSRRKWKILRLWIFRQFFSNIYDLTRAQTFDRGVAYWKKKVRMNVIQNIVYSRHIPWLTTLINLLVIHAIARKRHTSLYVLPSDPHTGWYIITGHGRQMHIGFPPWAIHLEYGRSHLWAWHGSAWNDKLFGFSILSKFVSGSAWTKIMH